MNYRTIEHHEDELLLADRRRKTQLASETSSGPDDATKTPITKRKSSTEEKLINNIEPESTIPTEIVLEKHVEGRPEQKSNDGNRIATDIDLGLQATSSHWVSFDESSIPCTANKALVVKQKSSTTSTDNSDAGILGNEGGWVKFEGTKEDEGGNGLNVSVKGDTLDYNLNEDTVETHPSDGNTQSLDDTSNPFSNSELERISSFSKSAKRVNGASTKPIRQPSTHEPDGSQTPKETLAATNSKVNKDQPAESSFIEDNTPLPAYPTKPTNTTWSMLLRYPDIKRRIRGREWRPVVLKLTGSIIQVYDEHDMSAPFREVSLQCFYDLTKPKLQQYQGTKLHTVKILYVKYKETQKLISKKNVQYIARTTPILKLASHSHTVIREFIEVVKHGIRSLPIFRDRGISHNTEAVYINVHDTVSALIDASGSVLMLGILVRIYLRAFISGDAECELVLNDIHVKGKEQARLHGELMPQRVHKWIKLEECDFHSTVNPSTYDQDCCIMLHPLDSCTFEVMQFRVRPAKPLPLLAKCELITDTHGRVEIRAEVKLCSDPKLARYERKNVCLYFQVPEAWVPLFMKEKRFRGERSVTSTSSQKAIKMRNRKNRPLTTIEVSTGNARYEPEFKSIVWRINQLPLLNTTAPADSTHDFTCHIQTMETSSGLPDDYKCIMEYEIPYTVASDTNVVNFKVLDKKIATREVTYHTYYSYEIQMNKTTLNGGLYSDR